MSDGSAPEVLSQILIRVEKSILHLSTNTLDMSMQCRIPAVSDEEGSFTLPARLLTDIIAAAIAPEITIRWSTLPGCFEARINPTSTTSYCRLFAGSAEDLPEPPTREEALKGHSLFINQQAFLMALASVAHAQSRDKTRFILHGVYFELRGKTLKLIGTDGRRLAFTRQRIKAPTPLSGGFILPRPAVQSLQRSLGVGAITKICFSARKAAFLIEADPAETGILDGVLVTSKLVEGKYPDYRKVIPRKSKVRAVFDPEILYKALHRVSLVNPNCVTLLLGDNTLQLSATGQGTDQANDQILTDFTLPEITARYNPAYILDALKAYPKDPVILELSERGDTPFLVIRAQPATFSVTCPIMKAAA